MFVVPPSGRGFPPPPPPRASGLIRLAIIKPSFPCQIFHVCVYVPIPILLFRTLDKLLLHITAFSKEGRRLTAPQRHPRLLCNRIGRRVPLLQCYVAYKDDDGPHRTTFFSLSLSLLPAPIL